MDDTSGAVGVRVAKGGKKGGGGGGGGNKPKRPPAPMVPTIVPKPAIPGVDDDNGGGFLGGGSVGVGVARGGNLRVLAIDLHALGIVIALVAAGYGVWLLRDMVTPFLLVAVLTFAGAPVVAWLEKRGVPRGVGAAAFVASAVLIVAALISMVVPKLVADLAALFEKVPAVLKAGADWIHVHTGLVLPTRFEDLSSEASQELLGSLKGAASSTTVGVLKGAASAAGVLTQAVLVPILVGFALAELPRAKVLVRSLVPRALKPVLSYYVPLVEVTLSKLLRGQLLVAAIMAGLYAASLSVAGVPLALAIGVLAGVAYLIPFAAGFVAAGLSIAFSLIERGTDSLVPIIAAVVITAVVQTLEAYVLTPRIVGEQAGLSPFAAILAVVVGVEAAGILGALFALPVGAVVALVLREEARRRAPFLSGPEKRHPAPNVPSSPKERP